MTEEDRPDPVLHIEALREADPLHPAVPPVQGGVLLQAEAHLQEAHLQEARLQEVHLQEAHPAEVLRQEVHLQETAVHQEDLLLRADTQAPVIQEIRRREEDAGDFVLLRVPIYSLQQS